MLLGGIQRKLYHLNRFLGKAMTKKELLAYDLFIESVMEPNHDLRNHARDQGCFQELMQIREDMLKYLYDNRKN